MNKELIRKAINALKQSSIIGFPTDTVYGIGCDAYNTEAVAKIYELKQRPETKPLILFIPNKSELNKYVKRLSPMALKLAQHFWPGSLTLVLEAQESCPIQARNGTVAVRIPYRKAILQILSQYPRPLATTSANLNGAPAPMKDTELRIKPDFVIPGECNQGISSTILDVSHLPPTMLRKGSIGIFELEAAVGRHIKLKARLKFSVLFVCFANRCRSPMTQGLAEKILPFTEADSCGMYAVSEEPPTIEAIKAMQEVGVDISSYHSKPISQALVDKADIILVAQDEYRNRVIELFPDAVFKTFLIKPGGIADPIGQPISHYVETRKELENALTRWAKEINKRITM